LIAELDQLHCFEGFIDSNTAKELLNKSSKPGLFLVRCSQSYGARAIIFSVFVDSDLRTLLATKGEPDTGESIYEFPAIPERNAAGFSGLYEFCGQHMLKLTAIQSLHSYLFKSAFTHYKQWLGVKKHKTEN